MDDKTVSADILDMTVGIVANYVSRNAITLEALPGLIASVHSALANAGGEPVEAAEEIERPSAAAIRKSVSDAGIVSFIDGKTYQSLKRHLTTHGLTPDEYRERYGLKADYPMVAPAYAAKRSALAKSMGLGRKAGAKSAGRGRKAKA